MKEYPEGFPVIREYAEGFPVEISILQDEQHHTEENFALPHGGGVGRLCVIARNEGGYNGVEIDAEDLYRALRPYFESGPTEGKPRFLCADRFGCHNEPVCAERCLLRRTEVQPKTQEEP